MKNILIVDGDKHVRESLAWSLEVEGYGVSLASSDKEASAYLISHSDTLPALIVYDYTESQTPCSKFITSLREDQNSGVRNIPVLIITTIGDLGKKDLPGDYEILKKPMSLDHLYSAVSRHLH